MMTLTVVTPSHAPDFESFARLHKSVVRNTESSVRHLVAVPDRDIPLFRSVDTGRLDVRGYGSILPRRFLSTMPLARIPRLPRGLRVSAINATRPWPPIRGWILQQLVKLAVVAELDSDVALLIDSDVVVIRPLAEEAFRNSEGIVRLYRLPGGITPEMSRYPPWQATARRLLGTDHREADSPDYISAFASWDPSLVRACVDRITHEVSGDWRSAVGASLQLSEFILYGTYVMGLADPANRSFARSDPLCHSHWDPTPLDLPAARSFAADIGPSDLAVHIQSNSNTDESVLQFIADHVARLET